MDCTPTTSAPASLAPDHAAPIIGALRVSHWYLSTVLDLCGPKAAVLLDGAVRGGRLADLGVVWDQSLAFEPPAGRLGWPRLGLPGRLRAPRLDVGVEVEVWPWDATRTELGLRPVGRPLPDRELWVAIGAPLLAAVARALAVERSRREHPAA